MSSKRVPVEISAAAQAELAAALNAAHDDGPRLAWERLRAGWTKDANAAARAAGWPSAATPLLLRAAIGRTRNLSLKIKAEGGVPSAILSWQSGRGR